MRVHELRVKQLKAARIEPCHQMHQRHLAGVGHARKHALAEKCRADLHPVKPANQLAVLPAFHRVAMAHFVELGIEGADARVDPGRSCGFGFCGAGLDDLGKSRIDADFEGLPGAPVCAASAKCASHRSGMIPRSSGSTQ